MKTKENTKTPLPLETRSNAVTPFIHYCFSPKKPSWRQLEARFRGTEWQMSRGKIAKIAEKEGWSVSREKVQRMLAVKGAAVRTMKVQENALQVALQYRADEILALYMRALEIAIEKLEKMEPEKFSDVSKFVYYMWSFPTKITESFAKVQAVLNQTAAMQSDGKGTKQQVQVNVNTGEKHSGRAMEAQKVLYRELIGEETEKQLMAMMTGQGEKKLRAKDYDDMGEVIPETGEIVLGEHPEPEKKSRKGMKTWTSEWTPEQKAEFARKMKAAKARKARERVQQKQEKDADQQERNDAGQENDVTELL